MNYLVFHQLQGVPQIEVTFDIDANGILNVSALEKVLVKLKRLLSPTIKVDYPKKKLIKWLVKLKNSKEEDEKEAARVQAKNQLESYAYSLKNTINDGEMKDKIGADDKEKLTKAIDETISWLDASQAASLKNTKINVKN